MTPLKAIRRHCLWCANAQAHEVNLCPVAGCPLHSYRFGKMPDITNPSPLGAIRKRCMDCSAGSFQEVTDCASASCALHMFRLGKNPNYGDGKRTRTKGLTPHPSQKVPDQIAIERSKS